MAFPSAAKNKYLIGATLALTLLGAPAFADEPTPAALALATSLLSDIGLKQSVDTIVPSMLGQIVQSVVKMHPEMQSALHDAALAAIPDFQKSEVTVIADIAHVLASRMSEQELKETVAFFEGPTGKKYIAAQGPMMEELGVSGVAWRQKLSGEMLTRLRDDVKKKGFDF